MLCDFQNNSSRFRRETIINSKCRGILYEIKQAVRGNNKIFVYFIKMCHTVFGIKDKKVYIIWNEKWYGI